ncbi:helix-turn-helix transcriptional regulator [Pandoraea sputorum]|uniref:S24 family peptidase n=1 Tax=Pandoraea sputorum TaxID=93222 RepID=UPI002F413F69
MTTHADPGLFRARLDEAIGNENLYTWGRRVGISDGTLNGISRGSIPKAEGLLAISMATGRSIDWLLGGLPFDGSTSNDRPTAGQENRSTAHADTSGEFVYIPRYDACASAGTGYWLGDEAQARFTMAFRRHWVENYLRAKPEDLSVLRVKGDSMEDVLFDGDNILINRADTAATDGIFLITVDGELLVKRLQRLPGGRLQVISDNPDYPPFEVPIKEDDDQRAGFKVVGRVVWFGRQL